MLYEAHQHKSDNVCNILDVSASNLRVLLHRARQKIFLMLETFHETGELMSGFSGLPLLGVYYRTLW